MKPIRTTCIYCASPILMIKSGAKTRRADVRKTTFVADALSETRYITESGDVLHGTPVHPDGEQKYDLLTGYQLHQCARKEGKNG